MEKKEKKEKKAKNGSLDNEFGRQLKIQGRRNGTMDIRGWCDSWGSPPSNGNGSGLMGGTCIVSEQTNMALDNNSLLPWLLAFSQDSTA